MTPIKKNVFGMGDITGYEVLDHLVDKITKEQKELEKQKKLSQYRWTDIRYADYDGRRYALTQHKIYVKSLYDEIRNAESLYEQAQDGARDNFADLQDPPF